MQFKPVPQALLQFIRDGSQFIILGHKEPDGDCIGSQLALYSLLTRMGKKAIACSPGPFKRPEVIPYEGRFQTPPTEAGQAGARLIVVDCSSLERTGDLESHFRGLPCAIIDHHASGAELPVADNAYIDSSSPSATLLVFSVIKALGMEPTEEEAGLLLFGLCTDTGFFRHIEYNGAEIFLMASELIKAGASPKQTFQAMYGGKSLNSRILLGRILSRVQPYFDGRLIITHEEYDDALQLGSESRDSEILNQLLQAIAGVEAIAYIRQETPEECSVGLRSRNLIDVRAIAHSLGGGGHKNAAGCTLGGDIPTIQKIILEKFQALF